MGVGGVFRIREAVEGDLEGVLGLVRGLAVFEGREGEVSASVEGLRGALFGGGRSVFCVVGEVGGVLVGFAVYFFNFSTFLGRRGLYLEDLFVVEWARGRGYGGGFLRYLAGVAVREGCGRFEWVVAGWNVDAVGFYVGLGAVVLEDWRLCRLSGEGLRRLGSGG